MCVQSDKMATITALKREHRVSKIRRAIDPNIIRGRESSSIAYSYLVTEGTRSKEYEFYLLLARGHYVKAAKRYKKAAAEASTSEEKDFFSMMYVNTHKRSGIMHLKLQDSAMGVWLLRQAGMPERRISNFVSKYIIGKTVVM